MNNTLIKDNMLESIKGFIIPDITLVMLGLFHVFVTALPTVVLLGTLIYTIYQILYVRQKLKMLKEGNVKIG